VIYAFFLLNELVTTSIASYTSTFASERIKAMRNTHISLTSMSSRRRGGSGSERGEVFATRESGEYIDNLQLRSFKNRSSKGSECDAGFWEWMREERKISREVERLRILPTAFVV
jgi:hypothetical protein